ncbi:cation-translocating P-type ATPase [Fundicoccus sp. Sow4_D5]|uniref:cation-translocating P-type ATPase n=1 Tax=unclassified Fundicoccus TaxID=2761543 RepID=UPI003F937313
MSEYFYQSVDRVEKEFETSINKGLTQEEVEKRREKYGANELEQDDQKNAWIILLENINNIIVYLLGGAALLSFIMGDYIEAVAVLLAVVLAVLTGFVVELRAQKSVNSLQKMIYTKTKVLRNGTTDEIESGELLPGDIMLLEEGDAIAADGRIVEANNFAVIESALTGESEAVDKNAEDIEADDVPLGDRSNMVFSGTAVTRGKATVIVTGTGMETEVGKISDLMSGDSDDTTPLDKEIDQLGTALIIVAFLAAAAVLVIGLMTGQEWTEMLHIAIILAVAAIPEAMPAVQTITLSRGMKTMSEYKALVKSLSAVETLGSTSVIASDKTGTLTENQMMVARVVLDEDREYTITGKGYEPQGKIEMADEVLELSVEDSNQADEHELLLKMIRNGLMSSNAKLRQGSESTDDSESNGKAEQSTDQTKKDDSSNKTKGEYEVLGDPTDGALVVLARKIDLTRRQLREENWEKTNEMPFDSSNKYMAVLYNGPTPKIIIKGAVDVLVALANETKASVDYWREKNEQLAGEGMRVIAIAEVPVEQVEGVEAQSDKELESILEDNIDSFKIMGLFGIIDPPRQDVKEAIEITQSAGIDVKMITGDHPKTASVIASQIGLNNAERTMTGKEIDEAVNADDFLDRIRRVAVFARVSPENKLQIIDALRGDGDVVAMTGDGVNDAPALNGADIGIAMGIRGTEVAKDASDMILTDDRFSSIVDAVREGRIIFANIKKYVSFLFACNMVEIITILMTILFLLPVPIRPLHVLFLNLLIDIGPAITLAFEPAEDDVMKHPPRDNKSGLVNKAFLSRITINGVILGLTAFGVFNVFHHFSEESLAYAQTATFTFMAFAQLLHILNVRHEQSFGLDKSLLENKYLIGAIIFSAVLQVMVVYLPWLQQVFGTEALSLTAWGIILSVAIAATVVVHFSKQLMLKWNKESDKKHPLTKD